jgi:uncharacterized protein YkwD
MMKSVSRLLPLLMFALVLPALGCAVPLPAPQLTATAESQLPPPDQDRSGSQVQSASSGAPNTSALSLQQTADDDDPPSALAPLEDDELAGVTPEAEAETPEATAVEEETPEPADTPTPQEPTATPAPEVDPSTYATELLTLLNQYRLEHGIPSLVFDATLAQSATSYAQYMATTGFFGHYPPSGSTPAGRIAAAGFTGQYKGEALSAGQPTPAVALSRLLGSSAHAAILLNPTSVAAGVGYHYEPGSYYGSYWVIVTANP